MNVNVLNREMLLARLSTPKVPVPHNPRVGYAVNFVRLTRDQQMD